MVELGVQSIYDNILKLNLRGHGVKETILATKLLKDAGFIVTAKIRLGFRENNVLEVAKIIEKAGADALTVHGRLANQGRDVPANLDWIKRARRRFYKQYSAPEAKLPEAFTDILKKYSLSEKEIIRQDQHKYGRRDCLFACCAAVLRSALCVAAGSISAEDCFSWCFRLFLASKEKET